MKQKLPKKSVPKKLQAIQISRHLRVVHRRHTGHVLPRQSTSYPTLMMIMLVVGVLLASLTRAVTADNGQGAIVVRTSYPGPAPTVAATIDVPLDGTTFTAAPITVSGSCPTDTYVSLLRNGFMSGTALCQANGTYSLQTDLFAGQNQLIARDYNFTDVAGPDSNVVTVTYTAPVVTPPDNSGGGITSAGLSSGSPSTSGTSEVAGPTEVYVPGSTAVANLPEPLLLKTDFRYQGFYVGQTAGWQVSVEGGSAPYAVEADWGDGTTQLYSRTHTSVINLDHVYKKAGAYHGSYIVKITATDAAGNQTFLQIVAIISDPPAAKSPIVTGGGTSNSSSGGFSLPNSDQFARLVKYVWPSYGVTLLMLTSFWLGERREFHYLQPRLYKRRRAHS